MTGKVLNLTRARKARARSEKARIADTNAVKHGRTKAQKRAEAAAQDRAATAVDHHRRDPE